MDAALGIRAEPEGFYWAVVEGEQNAPVLRATDRVSFPAAYAEPAALSWSRDRLHHLIDSYKPKVVAVRYPEAYGKAGKTESARKRSRLEGVLVEGANAKGIRVVAGALATISKHLGVKSAKLLLSDDTLRGIDWSRHNDKAKEAILVAASALTEQQCR